MKMNYHGLKHKFASIGLWAAIGTFISIMLEVFGVSSVMTTKITWAFMALGAIIMILIEDDSNASKDAK